MNLPRSFRILASRLLRLLSILVVPLGGMASAQPANVSLPAPAQGNAAIIALGAHLPEVARAYGLSAQQLGALFQTQPSLGVDREGALVFLCEGLAVSGPGAPAAGQGRSAGGPVQPAMTPGSSVTALAEGAAVDAFSLHSLPGVSRVIYLDFNGHVTTGTSWNSSFAGGANIVSAPFDRDGDPTTFNDTERAMIQRIWQRVAEDYAPFSVDVTTADPGIEALRRSGSGDTAYGIRVVISPTNWYNTGAGGVAYISSFNASSDTPCFVFTQQLASNEKYIAEAVAHEVGHSVGLYHDGRNGSSATEYYQGHGSWAPIMGVGYYRPLVQFSRGEYANANNLQDDLAVVANYVPLTADDHGNTLPSASVLSGPTVADGGTIETRSDVDLFRIDTGAGAIALSVVGPGPDTNLDLAAELLDANGQVLQTSNATSIFSASISATVPAGTFYLRISGVGYGDPLTTGYSDYGSIGNYVITGSFVSPGTSQPPVAVITASGTSGTAPLTVSFSGQNSSDTDGTITSYQWDFGTGAGASGMFATYTYTTAGIYQAALTVVDSDGLAGTASVSITVAAPPNLAPIASAAANVTTGTAPLAVTFSSAGSMDPDGSIASFKWEFGDGTSSAAASPTKTYTTPGNYVAELTVTDDRGSTASATVNISVLNNPDSDLDVRTYALTVTTAKSGKTATAAITVQDRLGRPVAGATITVRWTGVLSGTSTAVTNSNGLALISAPRTKKPGTLTGTITTVVPPSGRLYDPAIFTEPLVRSITL